MPSCTPAARERPKRALSISSTASGGSISTGNAGKGRFRLWRSSVQSPGARPACPPLAGNRYLHVGSPPVRRKLAATDGPCITVAHVTAKSCQHVSIITVASQVKHRRLQTAAAVEQIDTLTLQAQADLQGAGARLPFSLAASASSCCCVGAKARATSQGGLSTVDTCSPLTEQASPHSVNWLALLDGLVQVQNQLTLAARSRSRRTLLK